MKSNFNSELEVLRNKIDVIDLEICNVLEKRFALIKEIALLKKKYQKDKMSVSRQSEIVNTLDNKTLLPKNFLLKLYHVIFNHSIEKQKSLINKK